LLDLLYAQTARLRRRWYERHPYARRRLARPVISVGNLGVGGTGKTPLVAQIAAWLIERGERPAILSRGYGRAVRSDGVVVVSDGRRILADLDHAGDEPIMLARAVSGAIVAVSDLRYVAGVVAERKLGATVHVLDDGFQHVQLARDLDILMTRPGEITSGRVLPMGRLREGADAAARADIVVVLDADAATARTEAWTLGISQAVGARRVLGTGATGATGAAGASGAVRYTGAAGAVRCAGATGTAGATGACVAVAGIGAPEQFFEMLRQSGYAVADSLAFPDHRRYSQADVARIAAAAGRVHSTEVLTTEKDAVRFERCGELPFRLVAVPMRLEIDGWDILAASIDAALARAREAA
jgi:tetraacyldisaccharide 4'-kinase